MSPNINKKIMKKLSLKIAFVAIAAISLVLTSCNTTVEVAKRKHRKGYHVSISNSKTKKSQISETVSSSKDYFVAVDSPSVDTVKHVSPAENENTVALVDSPAIDTLNQEKFMVLGLENTCSKIDTPALDTVKSEKTFRSMNKMTLAQKFKAVKSVKKQLMQIKKAGFNGYGDDDWEISNDVMFIVMIVLSIILSPLAVYLVKGKSNSFILNLLLWLIGFLGLGIVGIPNLVGICALLAIIHALLVVLGHS